VFVGGRPAEAGVVDSREAGILCRPAASSPSPIEQGVYAQLPARHAIPGNPGSDLQDRWRGAISENAGRVRREARWAHQRQGVRSPAHLRSIESPGYTREVLTGHRAVVIEELDGESSASSRSATANTVDMVVVQDLSGPRGRPQPNTGGMGSYS
jgi:hypothetical protein